MKFIYHASPNLRQKLSTKRIMLELMIALCAVYVFTLFYYYTRYDLERMLQAVMLLAVSLGTALLTEGVWALCTKQPVLRYLSSSFGWITAMILTLMCTINTPPFAIGVATFCAIFFGKLLFGGFGQNIFNPAAMGRAVIFACFAGATTDAITGATPTTVMANTYNWLPTTSASFDALLERVGSIWDLFIGWYPGAMGETCTALLLIIGVILAIRKVIDWRVPLIYLMTVALMALVLGLCAGVEELWLYVAFHLCSGGVMFGAVFMLTDPVTSPTAAQGRVIFALGAGILSMLIRVKANLPECVLYSILLINMLTPLIERALDGQQVRMRKKAYTITAVLAVLGIALAALLGNVMESAEEKAESLALAAETTTVQEVL